MPNNPHPEQSTALASPGETTDVSVKGILLFLGLLLITCFLIFLTVKILIRHFESQKEKADRVAVLEQVTLPFARTQPYFPYPREQPAPREDLMALRGREADELNNYAWVDRKAGVVRIPISRAMDLILERGLPTRAGTNPATVGPSTLQYQQRRAESATPSNPEGK